MQKMDFFSLLSRMARMEESMEQQLGRAGWSLSEAPKPVARLRDLNAERALQGEQGADGGAAEIAPADG